LTRAGSMGSARSVLPIARFAAEGRPSCRPNTSVPPPLPSSRYCAPHAQGGGSRSGPVQESVAPVRMASAPSARRLSPLIRLQRSLSPPPHRDNQLRCMSRSMSPGTGGRLVDDGQDAEVFGLLEQDVHVPVRVPQRLLTAPSARRAAANDPPAKFTCGPQDRIHPDSDDGMLKISPPDDHESGDSDKSPLHGDNTISHSIATICASGLAVDSNNIFETSAAWSPTIRGLRCSSSIRQWSAEELAAVLKKCDYPEAAAAVSTNSICGKKYLQLRDSGMLRSYLCWGLGLVDAYTCMIVLTCSAVLHAQISKRRWA
jgi:hypothetical protein